MVSRMTTELFHAQLEENIVRAADERKRHQAELQAISRNYESSLDSIERMEDEAGENYRRARNAFEDAKKEYQDALRECRMHRNEAGFRRDKEKVEETNLWTLNNNTIQRHFLSRTDYNRFSNLYIFRRNDYGSRSRTPAPRLDQRQERRSER